MASKMDDIKIYVNNIKWTPQMIFEILLLLMIISSGGWLFLLLVTALKSDQPTYKYEIEVLSQILDGIFTYVCLVNSLPRIKMFMTIHQIIQWIDINNDPPSIEICMKLDELVKSYKIDYSFLLPNFENDVEIGNPLGNNKNKDIDASSEYNIYIQKTKDGLLILRNVAILLNLNWIFQIPITTIMIWYASIIPCGDACAFDNRPPEVIAVFLPLSFGCAASAAYILMKKKMSSSS